MSAANGSANAGRHKKLRILFLALEYPIWVVSRHISYASQLGLEEGFAAAGVEFTTITDPWFYRAPQLLGNQKFDQVWVEISRKEIMEPAWLERIAELAPVRVALLVESLDFNDDEKSGWSELALRKAKVEERLNYMTHVVAVDEADAADIQSRRGIPAMWWPQTVPRRCLVQPIAPPRHNYAVFTGGIYGERAEWLARPDLQGLLVHQPSPEAGTPYPFLFHMLHAPFRYKWKNRIPLPNFSQALYMSALRALRRKCFERWLDGMQNGCAVVNLPSLVKAYAGRIYESMAVGRPLISWRIPNRPLTSALFEEGTEILFYARHEPAELAEHIARIVAEPDYGRRIAERAQAKIRRFHTMEHRVEQILDWVAEGTEPVFY